MLQLSLFDTALNIRELVLNSTCHHSHYTDIGIHRTWHWNLKIYSYTLVFRFDTDLSNEGLIGRSVSHPPHVASLHLIISCIVLSSYLEMSFVHNDVLLKLQLLTSLSNNQSLRDTCLSRREQRR